MLRCCRQSCTTSMCAAGSMSITRSCDATRAPWPRHQRRPGHHIGRIAGRADEFRACPRAVGHGHAPILFTGLSTR